MGRSSTAGDAVIGIELIRSLRGTAAKSRASEASLLYGRERLLYLRDARSKAGVGVRPSPLLEQYAFEIPCLYLNLKTAICYSLPFFLVFFNNLSI